MTTRKPNPFAHLFGGAVLAATVLFNGAAVAQEKPAEVPATAPAQQFKDERALNLLKGMSDTLAKAQTLNFKAVSYTHLTLPTSDLV